jgi:hypothetical protein
MNCKIIKQESFYQNITNKELFMNFVAYVQQLGLGYLLAGNKTEANLCNSQMEACPLVQEEAEHQLVVPSFQIFEIC